MAEFDEKLVTHRPVAWNEAIEADVAVHYGGEYAGCVKKVEGSTHYECAISMERDGEKILQACGNANSIEQGALDVGQQWWLQHRLNE